MELVWVIGDCWDYFIFEFYICKLLVGGDNKIFKKIGEESVEVVMVCKDDDLEVIVGEVVDLFYYILVVLVYYNVDLWVVYCKFGDCCC